MSDYIKTGKETSEHAMKCELCNKNELNNYCTINVCEDCCKSMKCPGRYNCKAYPLVLEGMLKGVKQ